MEELKKASMEGKATPINKLEVLVFEEEANIQNLKKEMLEEKYITIGNIYGTGIDISQFLREDKSISLELLEVAIQLLLEHTKTINIYGWERYAILRELFGNQVTEEMQFVLSFSKNFAEQEAGEEIRVVALSDPSSYFK